MGYDMYWVRKDPEDEAAYKAAKASFDEAVKARDALPKSEASSPRWNKDKGDLEGVGGSERYQAAQALVDERYDALWEAERYYFRLNIWGMSLCRDIMDKYGMLCHGRAPDWPKAAEFGIGDDFDPWEYSEDDLSEAPESVRRYRQAMKEFLSSHPDGEVGIPSEKLGSNDGWLVTPEEIRQALAIHDSFTGPVPFISDDYQDGKIIAVTEVKWWPKWLGWLRGAIEHGGFKVH